ncbi:hypothetical protein LCGC14_2460470 [marine sediment metagenome]|uniref:DNA methylase N-4/N-6 domain-containing protein n=1 Tax=marine sediment metagenome TaxID=412755 RepID=A0A0F9C134_9ZZZZ
MLPKPYYQDDAVTIYHADCRDILPELPQVDLVLTDIPYGEVSREDSGLRSLNKGVGDIVTVSPEAIVSTLVPLLRGSAYLWCGTEQVSELRSSFVAAGLTTRLGIWEKSNPSPMNGQYLWLSALEVCVFARRDKATFNEFCKAPVWRGKSAEDSLHPTPKPEWLMRRLVLASSAKGDLILDPFMGSGTTLRAAKDLGRKAIGIEIEERYCEIAAKRMAQLVMPLEGV